MSKTEKNMCYWLLLTLLHAFVLLLFFLTCVIRFWFVWLVSFKTLLTTQVSFHYIITIIVIINVVVHLLLSILRIKIKLSLAKDTLLTFLSVSFFGIFLSYYFFWCAILWVTGGFVNLLVSTVNFGQMPVTGGYGPEVFKVPFWRSQKHIPTSNATRLNWLGDHEFLGGASIGDWLIFTGACWMIVDKLF